MEIEKGPVDLFPTEPTDEAIYGEETLNPGFAAFPCGRWGATVQWTVLSADRAEGETLNPGFKVFSARKKDIRLDVLFVRKMGLEVLSIEKIL